MTAAGCGSARTTACRCFDPVTETFRNYDTRDGLLVQRVQHGRLCPHGRGHLRLRRRGRRERVPPGRHRRQSLRAPVVLTGFNVFEKPVALDQSLAEPRGDHPVLPGQLLLLRVRLPGLLDLRTGTATPTCSRAWTGTGPRRAPGTLPATPTWTRATYTFMVKGTNSDGVWNEECASIRIVITPPFWKTWWFITCLAAGRRRRHRIPDHLPGQAAPGHRAPAEQDRRRSSRRHRRRTDRNLHHGRDHHPETSRRVAGADPGRDVQDRDDGPGPDLQHERHRLAGQPAEGFAVRPGLPAERLVQGDPWKPAMFSSRPRTSAS